MRKRSNGFTLIEIIVVIAIMALAMGIAVGIFGDSFERQAKKDTARLAAIIRFAYHASIFSHLSHRIAFDLAEGRYWVEVSTASDEAPAIDGETAASDDGEKEEGESADEEAPPPSDFAASEEEIVRRVKLSKGVKIQDVHTARDDLPQTAGMAYLYFFPNGFTEEAVIHFTNEEGTAAYSVIVRPLSGLSRIEKSYVELEKQSEE